MWEEDEEEKRREGEEVSREDLPERTARLEKAMEHIQEDIKELKRSSVRIEDKLDAYLEKLSTLNGKVIAISSLVGLIVSGIVSSFFLMFRQKGGG